MNKKERLEAVRQMSAPDCMPVYPRAMTQMIFAHGRTLPEVTGQDWYDTEKITEAVLASIRGIGYDVAIPTYVDMGFGVSCIGGTLNIPSKFGVALTNSENRPVMTKADWPRVRKIMAHFDVKKTDPRMTATLEVIRNVSAELGDETPLVAIRSVGIENAMLLFRPYEGFLEDMIEDPECVDEMCRVATDWTCDWICAQYEAGVNSITLVSEGIGSVMASPEMNERFNLENIAKVVGVVKKEFNQGTWMHLHGDMKTARAYEYMKKLAIQAGIEGFHLDENHPSDWVKEYVVEKLGKPACIIVDGATITNGPVEKIREAVKSEISKSGDGLGLMMAPSCQVLPGTPNEYFKAWVDATHEYGRYPLNQ